MAAVAATAAFAAVPDAKLPAAVAATAVAAAVVVAGRMDTWDKSRWCTGRGSRTMQTEIGRPEGKQEWMEPGGRSGGSEIDRE